ncbi:MAG: HD domain-containing protein [Lachnospiraceae bacterium]|nr:HD domain-containing protein [Lachnospiraceae bacterium]
MNKYQEMFEYVRQTLAQYDGHGGKAKKNIQYSRFEHIRRVYQWMLRLADGQTGLDMDSLKIAVIFHDIGYCREEDKENHAAHGAEICRRYLAEHDYSQEQIDFICDLIARHSDKETLFQEIPMELVLLMEADLLDDTGAHGVVMDVWIEALQEGADFNSMLEHIKRFTHRIMQDNPMRTATGRRIWEEKKELVNSFVSSLTEDLLVAEQE